MCQTQIILFQLFLTADILYFEVMKINNKKRLVHHFIALTKILFTDYKHSHKIEGEIIQIFWFFLCSFSQLVSALRRPSSSKCKDLLHFYLVDSFLPLCYIAIQVTSTEFCSPILCYSLFYYVLQCADKMDMSHGAYSSSGYTWWISLHCL